MQKPENIGFFSNIILLTGLTLSGLVPMFFIGDGFSDHPAQLNVYDHTVTLPVPGNPLTVQAAVLQASEPESKNDLGAVYQSIRANAQAAPHVAVTAPSMPMPVGFDGRWSVVSLDGGQVNLQVLKQAYTLRQTQNRAGAEYFDYAAYLFSQVGKQVSNPALARQFTRLSADADAMAYHIRQASALRFDGRPTDNLAHMKIRSDMLSHINELNSAGVQVIDLDQAGQVITQGKPAANVAQGQALARFHQTLDRITGNPAFRKQYPQTYRVVQAQAAVLESLAMNVELRWESVFDCTRTTNEACARNQVADKMHIYAAQTAQAGEIDLATESAIYQWLTTGS